MAGKPKRFSWGQFVDRAFWAILVGIAGYSVTRFDRMTDAVQSLNEKMAAIVEKVTAHEKRLDGHDFEIHELKKAEPEAYGPRQLPGI